jgi:hypothetical protein
MEWLLENRCLLPPHRFLDSAFGLARNDRFGIVDLRGNGGNDPSPCPDECAQSDADADSES